MKRYLVTGAAGFIGRSIAKRLLEEGHFVRGLDNFSTGKRANVEGLQALDMRKGDITDAAAVADACQGIDVIFHEAAIASVPRSVEDPLENNEANVNGTLQVLHAAKAAGVQRVIYAASSAAYGDDPTLPKHESMRPAPISPYAVSKLAGEYYMQSFQQVYGLETVSLRYFNVFGPYQDPTSQYSGVLAIFIARMLRGEPLTIFGDGEQSRDFTFIENVVDANLLAARAPAPGVAGKMFNIATGKRASLNEIVEILRAIIGYTGKIHYAEARAGDVKHSLADIEAARQALGFAATISLEEGLRRTVAWYKQAVVVDATRR